MKKFAFVDYGGRVLDIETRCACLKKADALPGELAIEDIIQPELLYRYVEIPEGTEVREGMLFSGGIFKENPEAPDARLTALENTVLSVMDAVVKMQGGAK